MVNLPSFVGQTTFRYVDVVSSNTIFIHDFLFNLQRTRWQKNWDKSQYQIYCKTQANYNGNI
jgi:hypothetical protein